MSADNVHADVFQIVQGGVERDHVGDIRRARLKFVRQVVPGDPIETGPRGSSRRRIEWRHRFEQRFAAVQNADTGRAEHFVRRKGVEIDASALHIDRHVRRGLSAIDQRQRADSVRLADDLLNRIDRSEHVGHMADRHQLCLGRNDVVDITQIEMAADGDRNSLENRPLALTKHHPRDKIGVMLHFGNHDLVTLVDIHLAPGIGHQVDDSVAPRVKMTSSGDTPPINAGDMLARVLVPRRRPFGERMQAAMDVGI